MIKRVRLFNKIVSESNIWRAWLIYRRGKRNRQEVRDFERDLEENLLNIVKDLKSGTYRHGNYKKFIVQDPKRRIISAPLVRDHIIHQAIYNILYPHFDKNFSPFSFSCRKNLGTDKAIKIISKYLRQLSFNYRRDCWFLHGDIEKCFDSINQRILDKLLNKHIGCQKTLKLLRIIIRSYNSGRKYGNYDIETRGIPLGNLISQLFINIYLDSLDKFVKERLKIKKYVRYADDFLIIENSREKCEKIAREIRLFLKEVLDLNFPENYQRINKLARGIEILGIKFLPFYQKTRQSTINRSQQLFKTRCIKSVEEKISD